jgi:hypothetical protein
MHERGLETFDGLLMTGIGIRYFEISEISDILILSALKIISDILI